MVILKVKQIFIDAMQCYGARQTEWNFGKTFLISTFFLPHFFSLKLRVSISISIKQFFFHQKTELTLKLYLSLYVWSKKRKEIIKINSNFFLFAFVAPSLLFVCLTLIFQQKNRTNKNETSQGQDRTGL